VAAICFSAAMHSVLPVDKNGVPLGNAITWADNRGKKEADDLKKLPMAKTIYDATGTPIHPMSPLIKIAWIKRHDKERFSKTDKFIAIKNYIIQQLTGECVIDYSLASATGLFNIHKLCWDNNALAYAGINADRLPAPVPVFYSSLQLRREYQVSLGLPKKTKIIIGASDGCMATLGAGVWGEGKATITIEQSGAVRVAGNKMIRDSKQRFFNYLLTDGYYVSGGPTNNGGVIFEWFAKQFGVFNEAYGIDDSIHTLIKDAMQAPAGSDGLLFLPYLLGERAPLWNANARGAYFGININHEQKHFIRATLEGILYEIYSIGKILEEHRAFSTLSINGSFASYPLWAQIIADMFGKPVSVNNSYDSIGTGALLLSQTEMGVYRNLEDAAKTVSLHTNYHPNKKDHQVYMKYFSVFEKLSYKLKDEFEEIALLQNL
ncbi:MAG TPA: gluconokinase, partial [Chitinophagaceae bacterium]|nr:gluconokinase [Chitinophagaceae bacterium]